jgi:hypothetical protein
MPPTVLVIPSRPPPSNPIAKFIYVDISKRFKIYVLVEFCTILFDR